jgi:hypothetical protein
MHWRFVRYKRNLSFGLYGFSPQMDWTMGFTLTPVSAGQVDAGTGVRPVPVGTDVAGDGKAHSRLDPGVFKKLGREPQKQKRNRIQPDHQPTIPHVLKVLI